MSLPHDHDILGRIRTPALRAALASPSTGPQWFLDSSILFEDDRLILMDFTTVRVGADGYTVWDLREVRSWTS